VVVVHLRALVVASVLAITALVPAAAQASALDGYRVKATAKNLHALAAHGFDVTEGRNLDRGTIDVVGTAGQIAGAKLDAEKLTANRAGRAATLAKPTDGASDAAFDVWTKYDAVAGDDKEQYTEQYARILADFPAIAAQRVVGTTYGGRDIVALQITKGATGADIPDRPAVLYNAMQHAREWLAGETCRRTLDYFVDNYGKGTSAGLEVTQLVDSTELWFVCVNNPDGYEYTFTPGNRLWRKNLRDNDGNGVITTGDGVDPNRNFTSNWGRDNDGSSPNPSAETYRGPSPASEPETTAMQALFAEIHPVFQKNDHTAAQLLLYPQGFQQDTPSADNEIFTALAGDPFKPGIPGFLPELSAGLYITNGDFTDWAYNIKGTLSFTPEGTAAEDPNVTVFEYPDSEQQIEQEFERHLPFVLDLAHSAHHPDEPTSHLGNAADDFTVSSFAESYGDPQAVGAVVKRKLGTVEMRFKVNGGVTQIVPTVDYAGGKHYYKDPGVFYHRVRGFVVGTTPGDSVEVWFTAGGEQSVHFTYAAVNETSNPVLILSNEDYSGRQPNANPIPGPVYLDYYKAALDAAGVPYDVYDVDAHGRRPPDPLGILSHYSHVVWYTGDDYVTREPDAPGGSGVTKKAIDTQNDVRDFLNDGGKLFFTGKNAGREFGENAYVYNPFQDEEHTYCQNANPSCIPVQDDFLQYYLGAYRYVVGGGEDDTGQPFPVQGTFGPFAPLSLTFNGADSAQNNDSTATLLTTSSVLDPAQFPLFADARAVAAWQRPFASPFDPHDGDWFLSAGTDDIAYKRLLKPFQIPAGGGTVKLFTSFDLEPDYDYQFVEIHTVGQDDWTTLEDANGHTSDDTGLSCITTGDGSAWQTNHPFLAHYQTVIDGGDACTPTGTSGAWNAATGNSGGWQEWSLPIPAAYAGKDVEIAVAVVSDPATQGLGAWVDELRVVDSADAPINSADPSFESGMDGWTLPGPPLPAGPAGQSSVTGWERVQSAPFIEAPVVTTNDTVYTGFAFEAITGAANRNAFMQAVLTHLGAPHKPVFDAPAPRVETPAAPPPPPPPPPPPGDTGGPGPGPAPGAAVRRLNLVLDGSQGLTKARRGGVLVTFGCTARCVVRLDLVVSSATQRRYHLPSRRIGRRTFTLRRATRQRLHVGLTRTAKLRLKGAGPIAVSVRATWTGVAGGPSRSGTVRLK
jgi:murein tripeptide amidase MpaA